MRAVHTFAYFALCACVALVSCTVGGVGAVGETGDLLVMGDLSTVGATVLVDGRRVGVLAACRDTNLWQFNIARSAKHLARYRRWIAFRELLGLGAREELRLRDRWGGDEWIRVTGDASG